MMAHLGDVLREDDGSDIAALLDQVAAGAPIPRDYLSWALQQGLVRILTEDGREPTLVLVLAEASPDGDEDSQPGFDLPVAEPSRATIAPSISVLYQRPD